MLPLAPVPARHWEDALIHPTCSLGWDSAMLRSSSPIPCSVSGRSVREQEQHHLHCQKTGCSACKQGFGEHAMGSGWEEPTLPQERGWTIVNTRIMCVLVREQWGTGAGERVPSVSWQGMGGTKLPRQHSNPEAGRRRLWDTTHPPEVQLLFGAEVNARHVPSQGHLQRPVSPGRHCAAGTHRCCCQLPLLCQAALT